MTAPAQKLGRRIGAKLALMALLLVAVAASVLIASATYFAGRLGEQAVDSSVAAVTREARSALQEATAAQLTHYDARLGAIAADSRAVARMAEQILRYGDAYATPLRRPELTLTRKGFLSNDAEAPASIMAWPAGELTAAQRDRLDRFSHLEPLLRRVQRDNEAIAAAWTTNEIGTGRYVPNRPLISLIPPLDEVSPTEAIFYRTAAPPQNPDQKTVWTRVYRDPAEQGLMVTVATPFHRPGDGPEIERFAGVAGLDVTLGAMVDALVATRQANGDARPGFSVLLDSDGELIAAPRSKWPLLGLAPDAQPEKGGVLGYGLAGTGDSPVSAIASGVAGGADLGVRRIILDGDAYLVAAERMATTGWGYVNFVPETHVLSGLAQVRADIQDGVAAMGWRLSLLTALGVLLTVAVLLAYVQWSFVTPLRRLAQAARGVGAGDYSIRVGSARQDELGQVTQAFDGMAAEIQDQIDTLEARVVERTRELEEQARTDVLTGLANRRRIMAILAAEHERSQRYDKALSVIIVDVDRFKQVNDRYGHDTGDKVLATLAACLQAGVRNCDWVGRFGGEELLIVLPETGLKQARQVGERLCVDLPGCIAQALDVDAASDLAVTVSMGVATSQPRGVLTPDQLLQTADANAYAAKRAGRNRVAG